MKIAFLSFAAAILCSATTVTAQSLPAGTALPVMLGTTLNAKSDKPGQKIEGKLMQEVKLPTGDVIKKGSHLSGKVVSVQGRSRITVQFNQLQDDKQMVPLNVSLRALAATESVFQAGLPVGASTSEASDEWVTQQVGGEFVFRGRGYVGSENTARWNGSGVWGKLTPGDDCPTSDDNGQEQALWVFSTTACGTYGFEKKLTIAHDGRTSPMGQITLESNEPSEDILVRGGSGWLLLVNSPSSTPEKPK